MDRFLNFYRDRLISGIVILLITLLIRIIMEMLK